jgi:hypothetical protein
MGSGAARWLSRYFIATSSGSAPVATASSRPAQRRRQSTTSFSVRAMAARRARQRRSRGVLRISYRRYRPAPTGRIGPEKCLQLGFEPSDLG